MKVRLLIFLLYSTLFFGCKKFVEAPKETCFIPYVDFVAYNVDPSTLEVSFTSITSYNGTITSHQWDFGDGTTFSGEIPPPHKYPSQSGSGAGSSYRITYKVANECGEAYWTDSILISRCLPNVQFTYKMLNDTTIQFTNKTTSSSPVTYLWDFGDSTKSTTSETTFTKTYLYNGKYTVVLKATNACGDNYYFLPIGVCSKPVPAQKITLSGCSTVEVDASDTRNGATYQWNFGNGVVLPEIPSPSPAISYTYPQNGSYTITLKVMNKNKCDSAIITSSVNIEGKSVVPNNKWSYTSDDLEYHFSRETVVNATSYTWLFGDGTSSTEQNPEKVYDNPGVYEITLVAANDCGEYRFTDSVSVPSYDEIGNAPNTGFRDVIVISATQIYYLGNDGILYKSDTSGNWSSIELPDRLTFNNNTRLYKDLDNNIWVYGRSEVARLDGTTWTSYFRQTELDRNTTIDGITVDNTGILWVIADRRLRKNGEPIDVKENVQFSAIEYAPETNRIWITANNRSVLYYVDANGTDLNTVLTSGIVGGSDQLQVHVNGDLFLSTGTGIIRTNSSGVFVTSYSALTTGGLLTGNPGSYDFDTEGNMWVLYQGRLLKVPLSSSTATKNYSYTSDLTGLSAISVLTNSSQDNDLVVIKTTGNAVFQIK